jgi:CRISPR-associated protein Csx16
MAAAAHDVTLIAFLGTGNYQRVRYRDGSGGEYASNYCPAAIARLHGCTKTYVLATRQAEHVHGEALRQEFARLDRELILRPIPEGRSEEEVRILFETLRRTALAAADGDGLILDITHGYRSQPFFAGALVQYLHAVRPALAANSRILYGAYEARQGDTAPIWELTAYPELAEVTQAVTIFLATGHGQRLAEVMDRLGRRLARDWAATKRGERPVLDQLARDLRQLCDALDAVRSGDLLLPQAGQRSLIAQALVTIEKARRCGLERLPLLDEVLDGLARRLAGLRLEQDHLAGPGARNALAALARLYFDWGRLAEAAIVLREAWTCLHAEVPATRPGQGFDMEARLAADRRFGDSRPDIARRIAEIRNDIEHGGFRKNPLPAKTIRSRLKEAIDEYGQAAESPLPAKGGTVWFVSRHPGAIEWAARQGLAVDRQVAHLDVEAVGEGDIVIGTLPVNLAATVCARNARFLNLSLDLPPQARGRELSADELERYGARLEEYEVRRIRDT